MAKRSVCIVGAGPGGLVTAKILLQSGQFDVEVFEKASRVGGIWALDQQSKDGFLSPSTPTNLSRFQVAFSDLSWNSIDMRSSQDDHRDRSLPMFPRAWQVNRYLETYREKHIPDDKLHLRTTVLSIERHADAGNWRVKIADASGRIQERDYDLLVLASGFFSAPRPLAQVIRRLPSEIGTLPLRIVHSGAFRQLSDLLPTDSAAGKDILVIGGSNSAGEVAGVIAGQLSHVQWSSDALLRSNYSNTRVMHVTPRPLYALPPYLPVDERAEAFIPLDFHFYNLAKRLPGPVVAGAGIASNYIRDLLHEGIQTSIGGDQSDLGAPAMVPAGASDVERGTVQVALTESYSEYIRSGMIKVKRGKVESIRMVDNKPIIEIKHGDHTEQLHNIGAIVYATGYTPITAIDLLDGHTKQALKYDPTSMRLPLILQDWQTSAPSIPELALHGFYEGPYWGIMEMQARVTAHRWLGRHQIHPRKYETQEDLLKLRHAMHARQLDVPQYWLGDYTGYMEEMAAALKLERNDSPLAEREGAVLPARYTAPGDDRTEAVKTMLNFAQLWNACHEGRYRARAVFRAMQGEWQISRVIESRRPSFPSGLLNGTASFHPRRPRSVGDEAAFDLEYLYVETGTFKTATGLEMRATRRYTYRYSEERDELSVWFIKPDSQYEVDYLFHNLAMAAPGNGGRAKGYIVAAADHLCIKDMYTTEYQWLMKGISLKHFSIRHEVHGPEKDYTATTMFTRGPITASAE